MAFRGDIERFFHKDVLVEGEVFLPDARLVGGKPGFVEKLTAYKFARSADHGTKGDPGRGGKSVTKKGNDLYFSNQDLKSYVPRTIRRNVGIVYSSTNSPSLLDPNDI